MLRVNKLLQSVVVLLTAVSVLSQSEDDTMGFVFETNEGTTRYRSSCQNFEVERYLSAVTISAFNKTEGSMKCYCSVRSTYVSSNVTVRVVSGDINTEYCLEDNSTIDLKLTFSDAITNGYLYVQNSTLTQVSADGVNIAADGGVVDLSCSEMSWPRFTPQLNIASSTVSLSSWASTQENYSSGQKAIHEHSYNAFYAAIGILGVTTTLLLALVALLCMFGRRKLVLLQNRLKELASPHGYGVEVITQSRAAMGAENSTEKSRSKPDTPYEDVSNLETNDRDTTVSTDLVQGTLPVTSQRPNSTEDDVRKGKTNANKKSTKHGESTSQAVSAADVRLNEPLDVYASAEEEPPQSISTEYAQLNRTAQPR